MRLPAWTYFSGSAVFHYIGPAFAVLLFAKVAPLGVAGLRIWTAAVMFTFWRRPWRIVKRLDARARRTTIVWGAVRAGMNSSFCSGRFRWSRSSAESRWSYSE